MVVQEDIRERCAAQTTASVHGTARSGCQVGQFVANPVLIFLQPMRLFGVVMPTRPTYLECLGGDKLIRCVVQIIVGRLWARWLGDASSRSPVVKHDRVPLLG